MGKCTNCGCNLIGTPENPAQDHLCHYCEIEQLKEQKKVLVEALKSVRDLCQVTCMTPEAYQFEVTERAQKALAAVEEKP